MSNASPVRPLVRLLIGGSMLLALPLLARCATPQLTSVGGDFNLNNTAPVARAGVDGQAPLGVDLALNGTGSYDPDGDEIVFHWSVDQAPEGSTLGETENPFAVNDNRNAGITGVVPDVEGVFIFALYVEDPEGAVSDKDYVIYEVASTLQLPVADAGPNQATLEGSEVCLDGSGSWDPSGRPISWSWTVVATPESSSVTTASLSDVTDTAPCFSPDAPGTFTLALVVDNELATSEPDFVFVAAGSTNQGPVANGSVISAFSCDFVQLSGLGSTDPENDPLNYSWDLLLVPQASGVALGSDAFDDPNAAEPRFYADVEGQYTLQLVVNDGEAYSTPIFMEIDLTEKETNAAPVVLVSPDAYFSQASPTCSTDAYGNCTNCPNCDPKSLAVDAFGTSDPDGDPVVISWSVLSGPSGAGLGEETGEENTVSVPGPPGSCSATVNTNTIVVRATATDCSGDTGFRDITIVYDCG